MYFDGAWETLEDGRMEYENGKVTAFCFSKDATFEQFIARLYGILNKSPDEYSLTVKTNVKSTHPTQPIDSLPIDIVDGKLGRQHAIAQIQLLSSRKRVTQVHERQHVLPNQIMLSPIYMAGRCKRVARVTQPPTPCMAIWVMGRSRPPYPSLT
ncbi:hypothetical protein WN944_014890 [Citrus x changshan-huyou]|uniref:Uncharacterized protein n=1 Tax=Citrus x changshan-huyou TaxID=2935761 RepID=A0AAP0QJ47_9ROSI